MTTVDLAELAELPAVVQRLEARLREVEQQLSYPVSIAEAAHRLGVTEKTVRRRIAAGEIAHVRTGRRVAVKL